MQYVKQNLDDADFIWYYLAPLNSATLADVQRAEESLGIKLPQDYIEHLTGEYPGIFIEADENIWPRTFKGGAFWWFLHSVHTYTVSSAENDIEDEMRLEVAGKDFMQKTGLKAVPIFSVLADADVYCADENGKIVQYSHEENTLTDTGLTFWQLFERELKELQNRKEKMVEKVKKDAEKAKG